MKSGSPSRTTAARKTQTKLQAWSSLVFHCHHSSFNPSEAPPWDSRPVSGAGVVHYHLLHRPRSVPTALGPAPLATAMLMSDDIQLYLSFRPDDPTVAVRISGCLADISVWMKEHHLQLNLANTELLVFPATPTLQHDFTIQLGSSTITPSSSVRNLGVIFDDQLTFKDRIAKTARSCRFALHNIRKIRPFLTQPWSFLDWTTAMLFWLDFLHAQSNLYKWFRMQRHDWSSANPKGLMLHLSLSPWTGSQLQLVSSSRHWCLHIEQPQAQHPPTSTHL